MKTKPCSICEAETANKDGICNACRKEISATVCETLDFEVEKFEHEYLVA